IAREFLRTKEKKDRAESKWGNFMQDSVALENLLFSSIFTLSTSYSTKSRYILSLQGEPAYKKPSLGWPRASQFLLLQHNLERNLLLHVLHVGYMSNILLNNIRMLNMRFNLVEHLQIFSRSKMEIYNLFGKII
ncbi:hypothetical protein ALC57_06494, partial [Trachymyrmex cornetzi]